MGFFTDKTFNRIYVHGALQAVGAHGGETFAFVYFLKAGIALPVVLASIAAMFASRLLFRQAVLPMAKRFGLRNVFVFGILLEATTYLILPQVTAFGPGLVAALAFWALSSTFYWTTMHAYVATLGSDSNRGKQVSLMEFVNTSMGIVVPIISGFLLHWFQPIVAFGFIFIAMVCSAIPILGAPHVPIAETAYISPEIRRQARLILFTDGLRSAAYHFTWVLALFITLSENFAVFGSALAFAGLVGAGMGLIMGRAIDLGHGQRAILIGIIAICLAITTKAFGYSMVWTAVLASAFSALAWPLYVTALNARFYNLAKSAPCPLRFSVVAEGGWDIGTASGCLLSAVLIYFGFSFFWPLLFGVVGSVLTYFVLMQTFEEPTP